MRIVIDIDGQLLSALLVDIEEDGPSSELEVRVDGEKSNQTIVYDRDDTIAVFPDDQNR